MKNNKGITLIALIVTIVVLLILANVSIGILTGDSSLIGNSRSAKENTEIENEKEILRLSAAQSIGKDKFGNLERDNLQNFLTSNSDGNAIIIDESQTIFTVKFSDSNRYYEIDKNGNVEHLTITNGEKILTVQCVDSKNNILQETKYTILMDKYSKLPPEVDGYMSTVETLDGTITEDTTIQILYYLALKDDSTLVFTGLDSSGNITTTESDIVSYMIGDGTTNKGNGLKEKEILSVLDIPSTYNGKPVTQIGKYAFSTISNILTTNISSNITTINAYAFYGTTGLKTLSLDENIQSIEAHSFWNCTNLTTVILKGDISKWNPSYFNSCSSWTNLIIENNDGNYYLEDNILYSSDKKTLLMFPTGIKGSFTIPETVTVIAKYAFAYSRAYIN